MRRCSKLKKMLEVTVALPSGRNAGRLSIPQSSKVGELKVLAQKSLGQRFAKLPGWILMVFFFPECITKGSPFTLGVWGLGRVRSTLLLCSQPFATVGNRSDMAVPLGSATKSGHFWRFQTLRNLVSRGRHGTSWHSNMFQAVLCAIGAKWRILLRRFQKMTSIFRGRRSTSDMSRCVFFANPDVRAASSGDDVQIPWHTSRTSLVALHTLHFTHHTVHSTLHRQQSTLHTWHFTLHTLNLALYTWRLTLYSLHCTLHAFTLTLHSLHSRLQNLHFTLHTLDFTLFYLTLHTFLLYALHSTLYTSYFTIYTLHCTLLNQSVYTPHFTL